MKALIVIDMQYVITSRKDFILVQNNIDLLIKAYREKGHKIVFTRHVVDIDEKHNPYHSQREESKIDSDLVLDEDKVILKSTKSIFRDTGLDLFLKDLGIRDLTIVGFNSDDSCLISTFAAYERGYNVIFVEDAVETLRDGYDYDMPELRVNDLVARSIEMSGGAEVVLTEDILGEFSDYYI
ncbi:cysteine hydrolase [Acidaminobacter sp. JC074]|uniref:cysteine hydrolase family protein n=1 Tax=Acidaminobacter sp. JC074 TaxID=2530199 RepID=UPI001F0D08E7|nr:cysteine hydrolase [Acidaminobacter sp. JC074]MCH4886230.1 cysteine hydrolase [Acidaminobacter sp. JC074]